MAHRAEGLTFPLRFNALGFTRSAMYFSGERVSDSWLDLPIFLASLHDGNTDSATFSPFPRYPHNPFVFSFSSFFMVS
jgi:hypothetical protein